MKLKIPAKDIEGVAGFNKGRLFKHQRRKADVLDLIQATLPKGSRVLDVGCASGDISVELALSGFNVHGIDFEPVRLQQAQKLAEKYGQSVRFTNESFDDLESKESYDGILLGEVIEHFYEPHKTLNRVAKLLAPGGKVFITTPNMPSLRNRLKFGLFGVFPDNNPEHLFYFDARRFRKVIDQTPFVIERFETRYTRLVLNQGISESLDNFWLGWFSKCFRRSGDSIFAVLSLNESR